VPGIAKSFGGSAPTEFGQLLDAHYPTAPAGTVEEVFDTFHRDLTGNPCRS